ncbi:unnamed protein product [Rangifer tarandus platyrhynchus]|uniref:Uncharacterized protein n=2 Tax=Rangifer tarandus platyrhynchus TaxID=3082113 RepID=A0ACB0E586_RANTA|nr:unnamed protein product [Rangifer tarandus platyrhynchus]CAI9695792.1 unnamed protein product [Rangifer tarandus platyrhynchus]
MSLPGRRRGKLGLGNLSGLVQARRKLKNFPSKTATSRRDKKQLKVINPCQPADPEVRVRLEAGEGTSACPPRGAECQIRRGAGSPKMLGSQGSRRPQQMLSRPVQRRGAGVQAAPTRGQRSRRAPPRAATACLCGARVAVLLEANFDRFTQRKHTLREDGEGLAASRFLNPEPELNQEAG